MFGRTLKYSFWNYYDNLGIYFIINFLWFVFPHFFLILSWRVYPVPNLFNFSVFPRINELFMFFLLSYALFFSPLSAALYRTSVRAAGKTRITFKDYFKGIKAIFFKSLFFIVIHSLITVFSFFNVFFYIDKFSHFMPLAGAVLSGIVIIFYLAYLIAALYIFPAVVSENISLWAGIKKSSWAAFTTLPFSLFNLLIFLLIALGSIVFVVPFVILMPAFYAQYNTESWLSIKENYGEITRNEENRSFRDFVFPWSSVR
ncbi:MAG: hypothetical protein A2096_07915 [Spirochaetes bacterium GWF1_41_5]|nr:MAG: hypothetical protein A2096_07915 [Spirochaetes bacterium GWF1_41_5]